MTAREKTSRWIGVSILGDRFHAWLYDGSRKLAGLSGPLNPADGADPEAALRPHLDAWLDDPDRPVTVVISGAPGAALVRIPVSLRSLDAAVAPARDRRLALHLLPGLVQSDPPAVIRGPETAIAGFLSLNPDWDGVICLPGPVTVWAQTSAAEIVSIRCFLTAQLAGAAAEPEQSGPTAFAMQDGSEFAGALADTIARPEMLAARLAEAAARRELGQPEIAARLWGALIGAELAAVRPYWLGQQIAVIGDGALARTQVAGLALQGAPATLAGAEPMQAAGLCARWLHR
ncbi:2-dehydro-3-deoxygalactonokinase [Pontibaca methylaminivorans]|uniref:2-dehydro-3-deoxygalactonokinase n=1 Tax=Pontibaca methylaminivorans TaxID=515897 RepID=A0A1R3X090_9RHOB|nr:2-dehydro-3-deoxygalactonokinase [Pontibaca methylaminivorans]SIT84036.1 2-dehydro-3-deoxygalactonokinase [Pontibaca methylaminivorans]